jgi:twitching motility two-component system response regulator PilH
MARVLIVDDSPTDKQAIHDMLKNHGHQFLFAADGISGFDIAKKEKPDIILMDVVMPDANGYQTTRRLAQDATTAHIPVVMISSKNQETDRVWGMRQGASAYICKPTSEEELSSVIKKLLTPA